ncbi:MAG: isoleucine--tRNA ligase [bacterium]
MFKKVDPKVDFPKLEEKILQFWQENNSFVKLQKKNEGKEPWSFIDGPITANNPMGVHHAWGRAIKDAFQRYKAMQGFDQRYQNGFDCQGLWVEVEVEKDLGFNSKKDIEKFGLDKFSKACRARVEKFSKVQTDQSIRLGQWMDWENSYYTMSETNNEYIWYFLKKCQAKGWLKKGTDSMPWCTRCGTAISAHELSDEGYKELEHRSVYVAMPLQGKNNENFLVWTTTPWTLLANVAIAVHPDLKYVKVKSGKNIYILSEGTKDLIKDGEVIEEIKGKDLVGLKYQGPFDELPAQKNSERIVIPWEEVGEEEGTGIVHIAPGCGEEDHELGKIHKLKVIAPLDEFGVYIDGFGDFTGQVAANAADEIFKDLKEKKFVFRITNTRHRYPICWRCKEELVFRITSEWFIDVEQIRPLMKKEAGKVDWMPESAGKRMQDWLDNMGDWPISRKRFWGLALPFYECTCGEFMVVGSKEELKKLAVEPERVDKLPELHRPWIDEIKIKCPKCAEVVSRVTDVGDCWLDAGIVYFSTLKYLEDKKYWQKWFPAEFVSESVPQIKLWFYATLFMSVTLEGVTPYQKVLAYATLMDEKGESMHKSKGNTIWFDEAVEKMGADAMRWLYVSQNPFMNIRFGYGLADQMRKKLLTLWNVYSFFTTYAALDKFDPKQKQVKKENKLDRWILSALNAFVEDATKDYEKYDLTKLMKKVEKFITDLSTWYVRRSRRRFWKSESDNDKLAAYQTLYEVLTTVIKILAPIIPFATEEMYQNLVRAVDTKAPESVHYCDFPKSYKKLIDTELNEQMQDVLTMVSLGHTARDQAQIKVRQPLKGIRVFNFNSKLINDIDLVKAICEELNVKEYEIINRGDFDDLTEAKINLNYSVLGKKYKEKLKEIEKGSKKFSFVTTDDGLKLKIGNYILEDNEYRIDYVPKKESEIVFNSQYIVVAEKDKVLFLNIEIDKDLKLEGMMRDLVRFVQELRKEAGFNVEDRITLFAETDSKDLKKVLEKYSDTIKKEVLAENIIHKKSEFKIEKELEIEGERILLALAK